MSSNIPFTIGADPEFFVQDKHGRVKSIIGRLGGTKENPKFITENRSGFAVQEDNVAAEYNIPPVHAKQYLFDVIQFPQKAIQIIIGKDKFDICTESAISFPDEELSSEESWIFGCEPDYNAWTLCINNKPQADDKNLRTAGGHIHVGYEYNEDVMQQVSLIKAMDLFLGTWSVIADTNGSLRRNLYGNAGAFRPKPYGVEYRVLSNFWIFDKDHCEKVWDLTERAVNQHKNLDISEKMAKDIQLCINTGNQDVARTFQNYWI